MSKKYHVERREFLDHNPVSGAYVIATVEDGRERNVSEPDSANYQEINLRIADDSQNVWLNFELYTAEDRENGLRRIRVLHEVITEFKQAIEREVEVINARQSIPKHARAASAVH